MFDNFRLESLNKKASSSENKPHEVINSMNLEDGDVVGDIGAGGGYFSFEFSKVVGENGKVYAIDTNQKSLDYIESKSKKLGINNIETVLVNEYGLDLAENVDMFFMRNVFHHLTDPVAYFKSIRPLLKNNGKITLLEYNKKKLGFVGIFGHYTPEYELVKQMELAGFRVFENYNFLPEQSFNIFQTLDAK